MAQMFSPGKSFITLWPIQTDSVAESKRSQVKPGSIVKADV